MEEEDRVFQGPVVLVKWMPFPASIKQVINNNKPINNNYYHTLNSLSLFW